jgi:predicted acylesterase/phospholipase RssA
MTSDPCQTATGPLANVDPPIHILLALQGGGALAAFEAGVLAHFHDGLGVGDQIRTLSGVSFGAITSAIYVANYRKGPIEALKKFWNAVTFVDSPVYPRVLPFVQDSPLEKFFYDLSLPAQLLSSFLNPNFYRARTDYLNAPNWIYLLDNSPLRPLLEKLIDVDELNSPDNPQLILTTVNIETGELTVFNNRQQRLSIDNVLASASLPPAFKPTEIDRQRYWDGALFDNSPFLTLLRSLGTDDIYDVPEGLDRPTPEQKANFHIANKRLVTVELFPRQGDFPRTLFEAFGRIVELNNRVKVTKRSIGNIYEFGVLVNWLSRYLRYLAGVAGGPVSQTRITEVENARTENLKRAFTKDQFKVLAPKEEQQRDDAAKAIKSLAQHDSAFCAQQALIDFFTEHRPDPSTASRESCDVVSTDFQTRERELNLVGIQSESLFAINEFAKLLSGGADPDMVLLKGRRGQQRLGVDFTTFFLELVNCLLVKNQVTRFSNIELFPLKTTVRSGLLSINDFSAGGIRTRFDAGLKAAQEQVFVAEFPVTDDPTGKKTTRDLMYVPPAGDP